MSRVVTSPVPHFSGTVTLQDPLYFPQDMAVQAALDAAKELPEGSTRLEYNHALMPGVFACVEKWELQNVLPSPTPDTFPTSPRVSAMKLFAWLLGEVMKLYQEAEEIPNA